MLLMPEPDKIHQPPEILAPAGNKASFLAAVAARADAVYCGLKAFSARMEAKNFTMEEFSELVRLAHEQGSKVFVALNSLLKPTDLTQAGQMVDLLQRHVEPDALIVQDLALVPLVKQTGFAGDIHLSTLANASFAGALRIIRQQLQVSRVVLPRELNIDELKTLARECPPGLGLEVFVHGALCYGVSGRCYWSSYLGGKSGLRGRCVQPCRRRYSLVDGDGNIMVRDRHLLSLRDLNLSPYLGELIDAGVTSFKIEGRLKDVAYVTNVVSAYRRQLDAVLEARGLHKSSSGYSAIDFEPDLGKTFNRGYTTHFLHGRGESPGSIDTPKMMGEFVGQVVSVKGKSFTLDTDVELHSGDGICFFDAGQELQGTVVNAVRGRDVTPQEITGVQRGTRIHRNHDHAFLKQLKPGCAERKIAVWLKLEETQTGFALTASDEDDNVAVGELMCEKVRAKKPDQALGTVEKQLRKMGDTEFACENVEINWKQIYFLPVSNLNALRRDALEKLSKVRAQICPVLRRTIRRNDTPYPEHALSYLGNALNQKAVAFYRRHGVEKIAPAAESGLDMLGKRVMRTRYCIKHQLGLCPQEGNTLSIKEPLYLVDEEGHEYRLRFDCAACEMEVYF